MAMAGRLMARLKRSRGVSPAASGACSSGRNITRHRRYRRSRRAGCAAYTRTVIMKAESTARPRPQPEPNALMWRCATAVWARSPSGSGLLTLRGVVLVLVRRLGFRGLLRAHYADLPRLAHMRAMAAFAATLTLMLATPPARVFAATNMLVLVLLLLLFCSKPLFPLCSVALTPGGAGRSGGFGARRRATDPFSGTPG